VQLRHIARQIGVIVRGLFRPNDPADPGWSAIAEALRAYERLIEPWARATATRMVADVARRDAASWHRLGQQVNRALREEIATAPTGPAVHGLLEDQVDLITSLPREAAQRVQELALDAVTGGKRWTEVAQAVLASGEVSRSRANTIARTETGRAATALVQTRAEHVGSPGYIWRTARDRDVRPRHRQLEGTFHRWNEPPLASEPGQQEMHYHPGSGPNCRCFPEVVIGEGDITRQQGPRPRSAEYLAALREQGYTTGTAFE
jgi:SPP1 gp7 family putative phage head morphogenesis protein